MHTKDIEETTLLSSLRSEPGFALEAIIGKGVLGQESAEHLVGPSESEVGHRG
tara:strand:+ start:331 stop:489 length:159 start_codon:yes stop_codon:yes gene_type:complete